MRGACGGGCGLDGNRPWPAGGGAPVPRACHDRWGAPHAVLRGPGRARSGAFAGRRQQWLAGWRLARAAFLIDLAGPGTRRALQGLARRPFGPGCPALQAATSGRMPGRGRPESTGMAPVPGRVHRPRGRKDAGRPCEAAGAHRDAPARLHAAAQSTLSGKWRGQIRLRLPRSRGAARQRADERPARQLDLDAPELRVAAGNVGKRRVRRADHRCAGEQG